MQDFRAIDFCTIELPSNFNVINKNDYDLSVDYREIKNNIKRIEGSNNFERWFCINLQLNECFLCNLLSLEECLSLIYLLKKAEQSNEELKETIRIWRQDELKLSSTNKFFINNILIVFYQLFLTVKANAFYINPDLDRFNKFIQDYHPRLLKSSDFVRIRKENRIKFIQQLFLKTGLKLIGKNNFGLNYQIMDKKNGKISSMQYSFYLFLD